MLACNIRRTPIFLTFLVAACGGGSDISTQGNEAILAQSVSLTSALDAQASTDARDLDAQVETPSSILREPQLMAATTTVSMVAAKTSKAMWSWRDSDILTTKAQQNLINFAVANKITVLYVSAQWLMRDYPNQLAQFINLAASKGITVELLLAHHEWALTVNHQLAVDQVYKANAFVRSLTGAKPTALHFDVEPHSLPNWQQNQVNYGNQLIDLYIKLSRVKEPGLAINADIAMSYRFIKITRSGVTKTLSQWMIDRTDQTTVMAYRDYAEGADSIIDHAAAPIAYAARRGKLSYVGVETTCGLEPEKITFCEERRAGLDIELGKVIAKFSGNEGFGGVAIHDFAGYSKLP